MIILSFLGVLFILNVIYANEYYLPKKSEDVIIDI